MTLEEQIEKFDELIRYIETELPIFAEKVMQNDLVALVTNRVVQTGKDYKGNFFSDYSESTTNASEFIGKSRTQAAERRIKAKAKARGVLSYKEFRSLNNLNTSPKNFEFTGEMWRKFGVIEVKALGTKFVIKAGGTTTASQNKIDSNSEYEGISIIEANESEKQLVRDAVKVWIEQQAERILNG